MKKVISALTAAAMCASMSASLLNVFAAPDASTASMYLKVKSATNGGVVSEDGKTVTFATAADAANASVVVDAYLKCETGKGVPSIIFMDVQTSDPNVKLSSDVEAGKVVNYNKQGTEASYSGSVIGDITTDLFMTCFATANKKGKLVTNVQGSMFSDSSSFNTEHGWSKDWDQNPLLMQMLTLEPEAVRDGLDFNDAESDKFPFSEFTTDLGELADGTYTVDLIEKFYNEVSTQDAVSGINDGKATYPITDLSGITIVVGDANTQPETDPPAEQETTEPPAEQETTEPPTPDTPASDDQNFDKETFYIKNLTVDKNDLAKGDFIDLLICVQNSGDTGAYEFAITREDGSSIDTIPGLKIDKDSCEDGAAFGYAGAQINLETGNIAASADAELSSYVAEDGATVYDFAYEVIDLDAVEPGVYKFVFSTTGDRNVADFETKTNRADSVDFVGGTLTITDGNTPIEEPTTEHVEPTTEPETPEATTEPETPATDEPATQPVGDYLYGDVNKNGKVELVDVVLLNRYLTSFEGQDLDDYQTVVANCQRAGESDADTTKANLDGQDSMAILKYLIELVTTLPIQG